MKGADADVNSHGLVMLWLVPVDESLWPGSLVWIPGCGYATIVGHGLKQFFRNGSAFRAESPGKANATESRATEND